MESTLDSNCLFNGLFNDDAMWVVVKIMAPFWVP